VADYPKTLRERIVYAIADPNIGFILLVLGLLGIYVEFSAPGLIFPGVAGGILALLGLSSLAVLPINWAGAALLVLGVSLFVLEAKFASHGILGLGGTTAMVLGAMLLINGPPEMRIHLSTALSVSVPFALITMFLVTLVIRARQNKAVMGTNTLVDQIAEARTALSPSGTVFLQGEYWNAESEAPVEKGGHVRVVSVEGLKLHVSPLAK
jgi:membrane-bound serine protease (ClpP class)